MNLISLAHAAEELTPVAAITEANHSSVIMLIVVAVVAGAVGMVLGYVLGTHPVWTSAVAGKVKVDAGKASGEAHGLFSGLWARFRKKPPQTPAEPAPFTVSLPVGPGARKTREQADLEARLALAKKE